MAGAYLLADELRTAMAVFTAQAEGKLVRPAGSAGGAVSGGGGGVDADDGDKGPSKKSLKKAAKGKDKPKVKDPNRWAVDPEKAKAKAAAAKAKMDAAAEEQFENNTPKGEKKQLSAEMAKNYHPRAVESAWQDWWEASGLYTCEPASVDTSDPDKKFVMVIPPPNVTGSLHIGHALTAAIEDTLTRWHRMRGDATLYVPGTDHAGIATQSVVEKMLFKEEKLTRHDLGREKFVEKVWGWKKQYGEKICHQIRELGTGRAS